MKQCGAITVFVNRYERNVKDRKIVEMIIIVMRVVNVCQTTVMIITIAAKGNAVMRTRNV
jgi:hypothetical protein